jgi:uncharacterized protein (TIGR03083 family)
MTTVDRGRVVAALDEVWDALLALAGELDADDWSRPTACPGWTVRDHYSHVLGTEAMLLGRAVPPVDLPADLPHVRNDMGRTNEAWVHEYRTHPVTDMLADLGEAIVSRRAALVAMDQHAFDAPSWTPAGQDTYGRFMQIRVMDQWFHEQDVREATGRPGHLDGLAPEVSLEEVSRALGYVVGKKAAAPAGSTVRFELTGSPSRRLDVTVADRARLMADGELRGEPTVTLTLPTERFFRIAGGRLGESDPVDRSVTIVGDRALGERILRNLGFMI